VTNQNSTRLNKYISHNTKYSRREADEVIKAGRVSINGAEISDLATKVEPTDEVRLDGKKIHVQTKYTVIVYNKPKGELVTKSDPQGRRTIYDGLAHKYRHFLPVGRLDFASTGVILLSDAPGVVDTLMHSKLERVYNVKVRGEIPPALIQAMNDGLELEDAREGGHEKSEITSMSFAPFYAYQVLKSTPTYSKLRVAITEGKNRELRRFFAHFGNDVVDLNRISFGGIELNALPEGKSRYLSPKEYESLHTFLKEERSQS
jgi:23S rRNA pseudouridine2605 synthase